MILERLASAFCHQNWAQIITEILIVVIGIFLGLQVTEWNEDREERITERAYLNRLHEDVSDVIISAGTYNYERQVISDKLQEVVQVVVGGNNKINLDTLHCSTLNLSHIFINRAVNVPTITELLANGQLSLIQSQDIRLLISRYILAKDTSADLIDNLRSDKLDLARTFPDLIKLGVNASAASLSDRMNVTCDFMAMNENDAFKNSLVGNGTRYNGFLAAIIGQTTLLIELHDELDSILNITH